MNIYNKYKLSTYIILENVFTEESILIDYTNLNVKTLRLKYFFKIEKRLMRSFIVLFFYTLSFSPFSNFNYKGISENSMKLNLNFLLISDEYCLDNYFF